MTAARWCLLLGLLVLGAQRRSAHVFTDGPAPTFGAASSDDRQMTIYVEYLAE